MTAHAEQARAYVVGGLDYTLTPLMRDVLVQNLARHGRCDLATALLTGWAVHRDEPATGYVRHALWGRAAVEVRAA